MKPCPFCGSLLAGSLVADIIAGRNGASCPSRPKLERRVDAQISGPLDGARHVAERMVALAMLGTLVELTRDRIPLPIQNVTR